MNLFLTVADRVTSATSHSFQDKMESMFHWDGWASIDTPLVSSLFVILLLMVIGTVVGIRARIGLKRKEYLQKPKGIMFFAEIYYDMCNNFASNNMGENHVGWGGYFWTLFAYLFIAFNISLFGLPSVVDWLACPLCLALIMFTIIQYQGLKYSKLGYFHRYVEPIFVFLPVNLITMWAPIISTTMRMFGNCLSGTILIGLIQWALGSASSAIFGAFGVVGTIGTSPFWNDPGWTSIFLAPGPVGLLNSYFSLFSGFIQTLVFTTLSAIWISQEMPQASPKKNEILPASEAQPLVTQE